MKKALDIDEYISGFPLDIQKVLSQVRKVIRKEAPEAEEAISYAIPAYMFNNTYLIYFAGYKNHIGIARGTHKLRQYSFTGIFAKNRPYYSNRWTYPVPQRTKWA